MLGRANNMDGTTSALAVKMCDPQKKKKATIAVKKRIENVNKFKKARNYLASI